MKTSDTQFNNNTACCMQYNPEILIITENAYLPAGG